MVPCRLMLRIYFGGGMLFMLIGIVHFAGTTHGDAEMLCHEPLRYPLYLSAAMPLYLSIVASFQRSYPNSSHRFSNRCKEAIAEIESAIQEFNVTVKYNPGLGNFTWPPQW